jgi:hypothetical protein
MSFDPDNWIFLWVITWLAVEELHSNDCLFKTVSVIVGMAARQENEKVPQPRRGAENLAATDSLDLPLDSFLHWNGASITEKAGFEPRI